MARSLVQVGATTTVREKDLQLAIPIDESVTYTIRAVSVDKVREITKANTRKVPNKRTHQLDEVIDDATAADDLLDFAILSWEGVNFNGTPAPCDRTHKKLLPAEVQKALVDRAQIGQVTPEQQAASFRESDGVR